MRERNLGMNIGERAPLAALLALCIVALSVLGVSKTTTLSGRPLKLNVEIDYSVVRPDIFGAEWLLKFSFTPVIKNPFL
jgi:hypothetical protein